jgi:hypothetical protein
MLSAGGGAAPTVVITPSGAAALVPGTAVVLPGSVGFVVTDGAGAAYGILSAFSVGPGGGGGGSGAGAYARVLEDMHLLPKEFAAQFRRAELNIEDYVMKLETGRHRLTAYGGVHTNVGGNWNRVWRDFFDAVPRPRTKQEILDQLAKMLKDFGLE